jgi:peptidoglycan/LPS O-acetylase OafA/YrhL
MSTNSSDTRKLVDTEGLGHLPGLDGLRACAFLLILVWHVTSVTGWYGVDLFFVLSGFLISRILLKTREKPGYFTRFYVRRVLRIFPLYYAFLFINPLGAMPEEFGVWFYTYASNFLVAREQHWVQPGHLWSLAVEEQFYLIWPIVLWLVASRGLGWAMFSVCLIAWCLRIVAWASNVAPLSLYVLPWFRVDAFAWGGLVALGVTSGASWYRWIVDRRYGLGLVCAGTFVYGLGIHPFENPHWYWPVVGATNLYVLSALLLVQILNSQKLATFLDTWPLRAMGRISYGLYVWHLVAVEVAWAAARLSAGRFNSLDYTSSLSGQLVFVLPLALVLSVFLALASWFLLERPFLRLKTSFRYSSDCRGDSAT